MPKDEMQKATARNTVIALAVIGAIALFPVVKSYTELKDAEKQLVEASSRVNDVNSLTAQIYSMRNSIAEAGNTSKVIEMSGFPLNDLFSFLNGYSDKVMILSVDTKNVLDEIAVVETQLDADGNPIPAIDPNTGLAVDPNAIPDSSDTEAGSTDPLKGYSEKAVTIRGTSIDSGAIADLFYELSIIHFVSSSRLVGIEEKTLPNGIQQNLFEIQVVVK